MSILRSTRTNPTALDVAPTPLCSICKHALRILVLFCSCITFFCSGLSGGLPVEEVACVGFDDGVSISGCAGAVKRQPQHYHALRCNHIPYERTHLQPQAIQLVSFHLCCSMRLAHDEALPHPFHTFAQGRLFRPTQPQSLLRLAGQFQDCGVGRTFRYENHPPGTTVTVTRVRLKVCEHVCVPSWRC